jgi:ketosteroid isomerase-like protein
MGRYEVQIFDSFGRERVGTGDMGGIYQRMDPSLPEDTKFSEGSRPMTNATKPPGEWQKLDIIFRAPRFDDAGQQRGDAFFEEVRLNGTLVQRNFSTTGPTTSAPMEGNVARGPVAIQGDHGPIAIRSLRITPLEQSHTPRIPELDAYWAEVSRSVREGDFKAYTATCHPEAVLISGVRGTTQPITTALSRWKKDFSDTKEGKVRGNVEFRFSKRIGDFTTAYETGVFRYTTLSDTAPPKYDYMRLEAILVKRAAAWQILIENQVGPATEADWNALR